jgi:hypothetical protein
MSEPKRAVGASPKLHLLAALGAALSLLSACEGSVESQPGPGASSSAGSGGAPASQTPLATTGPRPLTRLTRREYNNTVRDLLGDTTRPADDFADDHDHAFLFRRSGLVATQDAELLRSSAEQLAKAAVARIGELLPCAPAGGEDACAAEFISSFGLRAFRRPLSEAETARLIALYRDARDTQKLDFNGAIGLLIEGMLQSPAFLYHWESPYTALPRDGDAVALAPYDIAARLSYFIWGSMPDRALFDAAAAGKLASDAEISEQAGRLLGDAKAKDSVSAFFREWLEIDQLAALPKDAASYPEYDDGLKAALVAETETFAQTVLLDAGGRLETLLTADYSFSNQLLSKVYGGGATGTALTKTTLDTSRRLGLLTHPSFLSTTGSPDGSNPVKRGKAVYLKLLCGVLPPPPPNVPPAKPASAGGTTRQRFDEHGQNECARGCHALMDPIGFAFEHYDGIGRYRTTDNGQDVDASGTLKLDGVDVDFKDAVELSQALASSDTVRSCFANQWFRFAVGRMETPGDAQSLTAIQSAFAARQFDMRDLAPAIAVSRSFRFRSLAAGEK